MNATYEFFEHTADVGVRVYGATLRDLFTNAASALYDVLGKFALTDDTAGRFVKIKAETTEDLLHDWLAELLYDLETQQVFYDQIEIADLKEQCLTASLRGGKIDFARSQTNEEIKAVTYHQLRVEQVADGSWLATVIFDV